MRCIPKIITYDKNYDILYCGISDTSNSYGDQIDNTLVLLKDMETDEITGVTIYGFEKMFKSDERKRALLSKYIELPTEYIS